MAEVQYYQQWLDADGRLKSDRTLLSDYLRERYDNPRQRKADVIVGLAAYSGFRPFDGWMRPPEPPADGEAICPR